MGAEDVGGELIAKEEGVACAEAAEGVLVEGELGFSEADKAGVGVVWKAQLEGALEDGGEGAGGKADVVGTAGVDEIGVGEEEVGVEVALEATEEGADHGVEGGEKGVSSLVAEGDDRGVIGALGGNGLAAGALDEGVAVLGAQDDGEGVLEKMVFVVVGEEEAGAEDVCGGDVEVNAGVPACDGLGRAGGVVGDDEEGDVERAQALDERNGAGAGSSVVEEDAKGIEEEGVVGAQGVFDIEVGDHAGRIAR